MPPSERGQGFWPRIFLALLCVGILVLAIGTTGHSIQSVDVRTYVEMMRGIHDHGVPVVENGPVDRFRALEVPWNVIVNGRLWGTYPPLYPYLMAPLLAGGLHLVAIATYALLVPLALVTFALARRVLKNEWYALLAASGAIFSSPIAGNAYGLSGYPLAIVLTVAAVLCTVIAIDVRGRRRLAAAAGVGLLSALASATHLLCFPMGVASLGVLVVADATEDGTDRGPRLLGSLRSFWPTKETLASALVATTVFVLTLVPVAVLNRLRFNSYNPLTYGPVPWRSAEWARDQSIGAHLRFAAPTLALAGIVAVVWFLASRVRWKRGIRALALAVAALVLALRPELLEHSTRVVKMFVVFAVDLSAIDLGWPYYRPPGGIAQYVGPWVLKSTLQATPVLALLAVVPPTLDRCQKHRLFAVLIPGAALYGALTLRANLPLAVAVGWSWIYLRYTLPAGPLLLVAALTVVREVAPHRRAWWVALLVFGSYVGFLSLEGGEDGVYRFSRQVILVIVPLVLAVCGVLVVVLHRRGWVGRHVTGVVVCALVGTGFGIGVGHDYRSGSIQKDWANWAVDSVSAAFPTRYAMFGKHWAMDQMLSLRAERDVQYADEAMVDGIETIRPLIDHWFAEQRPVFYVAFPDDPAPTSPWPDIEYELVQPRKLYRLVRRAGEE